MEFGVKLNTDEERMCGDLDDLREETIGRSTGDHEPASFKLRAVGVIHFVTVPMTLGDLVFFVGSTRDGLGVKSARITS